MRIWMDIVHPKGAWLASSLLPQLKGEVTITAREGVQTVEVLDMLGISHTVVGRYGLSSEEKFVLSAERGLALMRVLGRRGFPDILYAHGSVEATRLAFGVGIPIVHANDTIINTPVLKLTLPLVDRLVTPACLKGSWWTRFGISPNKILHYNGVEEVAYVKRHSEREVTRVLSTLFGAIPGKLVVMRGLETKASYVRARRERLIDLVKKVAKRARVIYLPRYDEERGWFGDVENVLIPSEALNVPLLVGASDLVISGGGTIAREASLLGTPSISLYLYDAIGRYLAERGFPLLHVPDPEKAYQLAARVLERPANYMIDTRDLLEGLESPVPYILEAISQVT